MRVICILALSVACATAVPSRIVGGSVTTIDQYPSMVSMLASWEGSTYSQTCGGTIINSRSILTAAHCTIYEEETWRARVGSKWANSGGTVYTIIAIITHPEYDQFAYLDSDISIARTATAIAYVNNAVQPAFFAGPNYNPGDDAVAWATGWGGISELGPASEQLRHVQVWTINQKICAERYIGTIYTVTDNMLCSGWLDVGGRDQCIGDSGGPLYHNGVVIGVCSYGEGCGSPYYPGVNARVSRFINWIQANA